MKQIISMLRIKPKAVLQLYPIVHTETYLKIERQLLQFRERVRWAVVEQK